MTVPPDADGDAAAVPGQRVPRIALRIGGLSAILLGVLVLSTVVMAFEFSANQKRIADEGAMGVAAGSAMPRCVAQCLPKWPILVTASFSVTATAAGHFCWRCFSRGQRSARSGEDARGVSSPPSTSERTVATRCP